MKKHAIQFEEAHAPVRDPIDKLGGVPNWLDAPRWPIGTTGQPMQFVCQIRLEHVLADVRENVAYVFFTDDPICAGYGEAGGGDCAVIIQPGGEYAGPTKPLVTGPTVYQRSWVGGVESRRPVEFTMTLTQGIEAATGTWDDVDPDDDDAWDRYFEALREEKIGGRAVPTANRMGAPFPVPEDWLLLVQLRSRDDGDAFFLNMAGDGTGYAFVSPDGRRGTFFFDR